MRNAIFSLTVAISAACGASIAAAQGVHDKPSYCVSQQADFYPYQDGQICRKGYQVAAGNCHLKDGTTVAVAKADCARMSGDVALPAPAALLNSDADPKQEPVAKPLTVKNPNP